MKPLFSIHQLNETETMKLSKKLFSSGTLHRGQVRHCSEWDFPEAARASRFGESPALRQVLKRRAESAAVGRGKSMFGWIPSQLGWGRKE